MVEPHDDALHVEGVDGVAGDGALVPLQAGQQVEQVQGPGHGIYDTEYIIQSQAYLQYRQSLVKTIANTPVSFQNT